MNGPQQQVTIETAPRDLARMLAEVQPAQLFMLALQLNMFGGDRAQESAFIQNQNMQEKAQIVLRALQEYDARAGVAPQGAAPQQQPAGPPQGAPPMGAPPTPGTPAPGMPAPMGAPMTPTPMGAPPTMGAPLQPQPMGAPPMAAPQMGPPPGAPGAPPLGAPPGAMMQAAPGAAPAPFTPPVGPQPGQLTPPAPGTYTPPAGGPPMAPAPGAPAPGMPGPYPGMPQGAAPAQPAAPARQPTTASDPSNAGADTLPAAMSSIVNALKAVQTGLGQCASKAEVVELRNLLLGIGRTQNALLVLLMTMCESNTGMSKDQQAQLIDASLKAGEPEKWFESLGTQQGKG